jgi:hypothetical protein
VNERLCIEEVGVDHEPLCSCPWTRCRPSRKLLAKYLSIGIIHSVSLNVIPCSYGFDHAILIWYIWEESIPVPRQFSDKVKASAVRRSMIQFSSCSILPLSITLWYLEDIVPSHYLLWILAEVILLTVLVIPRVRVVRHSRTPTSDSNPHYALLLLAICCWSFILNHVIPSLIGYIIIVLILTVLLGLLPGAQFSTMS